MQIRLKNIGLVDDSAIEVKGLTVIAGHNNSGKTTVGKVVYSLVDAVSNIEDKAAHDKYNYVISQIEIANKELSWRSILKRVAEQMPVECLRIFFLEEYRQYIGLEALEQYLIDLINELRKFSVDEEPYRTIILNYQRKVLLRRNLVGEEFEEEKQKAIEVLEEALYEITRDPELIDYTRQSINETLSVEFAGQIQPAAQENVFSSIEMLDGSRKCFFMELYDNEIVQSDEPVYNWMPYNNTYFIDNPYIVGEPIFRRTTRYTTTKNSYMDEAHILSHENKLKAVVNRPSKKSVFESGIIETRYKRIKEKIDDILPGEFTFTSEGQFYNHEGVRLKALNLATGSKMFSIIKLLLSKGEITEKTLLVLDEPEAHLHPEWQNLFAEIMVLLVKEVGCHVLLTTHSPNFLMAIEAYSKKYELADKVNYYIAKHNPDDYMVGYIWANDNLSQIYSSFALPLVQVKRMKDE